MAKPSGKSAAAKAEAVEPEPDDAVEPDDDVVEPDAAAAAAATAEQEVAAQTQTQRQEVPFIPAENSDPQGWTEPGWKQGLFPGDPNTYVDPDNPPKSY